MTIRELNLENFRNYERSVFTWAPRGNLIVGPNASGKTSILEAISFLALTKSFSANSDAVVLSIGKEVFNVEGTFHSDGGLESVVRVGYDGFRSEKVVWINGGRVERLSSMIGKYPVVILSPEHSGITRGAPAERRRFVDLVICQSSSRYCADLVQYRKVVKLRNRVLSSGFAGQSESPEVMESWNEQLLKYGSRLVSGRLRFVGEFGNHLKNAYSWLAGIDEEPTLSYMPFEEADPSLTEEKIKEMLQLRLRERAEEEMRIGSTLVGPHRDDFRLRINKLDVRRYASQGQHKTFLVALKLAEFLYLQDISGEKPLVLLDDVFGELDLNRSRKLLGILDKLGQTFVTSTDTVRLAELVDGKEDWREIHVGDGVTRCAETEV
ncbi:MAG: DNA replication/repair protein RecF [Bacteroidota bacterium]